MEAYSCGITKTQFINEIKIHKKLDNFIQGTYGKDDKGCAIGCSIMSIAKLKDVELDTSQHYLYETYLGIPTWLAYLEDRIFERLPLAEAKEWPLQFSSSINTGSDLEKIKVPFLTYVLQNNIEIQEKQLKRKDLSDTIRKIILQVIAINKQTINTLESNDLALIKAEASAAWTAIESAASAVSATWSAASAVSAASARSATWSAASSVESAVSAASAVESAVSAASEVESAAWTAVSAAGSEMLTKLSIHLIQLLKECK